VKVLEGAGLRPAPAVPARALRAAPSLGARCAPSPCVAWGVGGAQSSRSSSPTPYAPRGSSTPRTP